MAHCWVQSGQNPTILRSNVSTPLIQVDQEDTTCVQEVEHSHQQEGYYVQIIHPLFKQDTQESQTPQDNQFSTMSAQHLPAQQKTHEQLLCRPPHPHVSGGV